MATGASERIIVFLASPGDLGPEREEARRVVDWVNQQLASQTNVWVDVKGWEDTGPYAGAPQSLLNEWVDDCHILVGMLWEAWGEPTADSSSGFEEEFARADKRWQQQQEPQIWLYFKEVHPAHTRSPGKELARNLKFRNERREKKDHRFAEFSTTAGFAESFRDRLLRYMVERVQSRAATAGTEESVSRLPPSVDQRASSAPAGELAADRTEAIAAMQSAIESIRDPDARPLTHEQTARFYLLAAARLFGAPDGRVPQVLGVHEGNIFYAQRKQLELTGEEWTLLVRSTVADEHGTHPGYYWTRTWSAEATVEVLSHFVLHDVAPQVRAGALRLLTMAGHEAQQDLLESAANDTSAAVRLSLIRYIVRAGQARYAEVARRLVSDNDWTVRTEAERAYYVLTARNSPDQAFTQLATQTQHLPSESLLRDLLPYRVGASASVLRAMLDSDSSDLRRFGLDGLAERKDLTTEEARRFAQAADAELAAAAMRFLVDMGESVNGELGALEKRLAETKTSLFGLWMRHPRPDEQVRHARLRRLEKDELLRRLHFWFFHLDAPYVYSLLAMRHFEDIQALLRQDIRTGFQSLKERGIASVKAAVGPGFEQLAPTLADYEFSDFRRRAFVEAVVPGLAAHGDRNDQPFAREVLADTEYSTDTRAYAARLLGRHGEQSDTELLLSTAAGAYGALKTSAARAAVALDPGLSGAPGKLLESGSDDLVTVALKALLDTCQMEACQAVTKLLQNRSTPMRTAAVAFLLRTLDDTALEEALDCYISQPSYYYSVVCQLDKVLYAPDCLRNAFRQEVGAALE